MKRSGFQRTAAIGVLAVAAVQRKAAVKEKKPARKSPMKSKGPRMTPIRKSARGQDCTMRIPGVCNCDTDTTVLAHSNFLADGKGMGLKAPDTAACYACSSCHDVLDGRRVRPPGITAEHIEGVFYSAVEKTHVVLRKKGLIE